MTDILSRTYKILALGIACSLIGIFPIILESSVDPTAFETPLTTTWRTLLILSTIASSLAILCYGRALYLLRRQEGDAS